MFSSEKDIVEQAKKRLQEKMGTLSEDLNRLDYRDFLAVNKYVIEAQRAEDYHIHARGKVLAAAIKRQGSLRVLENIKLAYFRLSEDKISQVSQRIEGSGETDVERLRDLKLQASMEQDGELEHMYKEEYFRIKAGKF